ncbi:RNA polymerase II C-terminal domain phosphatase-like [Heracleum sosnowskyi]|uniref:protein-serine/threonine phosphatase n=1 Tax=Heracleum sosnowskyi TaxID=360622 RepID=A0AAD8HN53_9APIA|nr:RNA polymerase II C-terminal domain phosphatase-like [Heracleum sosnowskyi]
MAQAAVAAAYQVPELDKLFQSMEIENTKLKILQRQNKLCLILDLDHTLIHSKAGNVDNVDGNHTFLIKLRPFVHEFLKEANKLFEMYVYTLATRDYAMGVVSLLDPDGLYFGSRIIASEDSTDEYQKSLDVLPDVDENFVIILDDLNVVWSKYLRNLIVIQPYNYFDPPNGVFSDEKEGSGALNAALEVLKEVHTLYFKIRGRLSVDCDVRDLLEAVMNT